MLQQLHVGGDGEDVHEVEEDVHHDDDSQVDHTLQVDVPHLPLFPGQVGLVGLQRAADACLNTTRGPETSTEPGCSPQPAVDGVLFFVIMLNKQVAAVHQHLDELKNNPAHLNIKFVKGHDGTEIEEREVEVVLEQLQDVVVPIFPLTVLQSKAHTAHDCKPTTSIEEDVTQLKVALHKTCLYICRGNCYKPTQ